MPSKTYGRSVYIALALAATAAIMSAPGQADNTGQILQLLFSTAAPDAAAIAGAIGDNPQSLMPP
jgi:hypothetical protein